MSKPQHFNSLLSPSQGKFPQPPPTSSDKSRHFKFSEPSPGKSTNKSSSKFVQPGYSSTLQELSAEISDVYDFRQKCFDKIKSLETVIERNRGTYENEINYMQEYIKLLKRKLAKGKGINESLDMQCEDCKDKEKTVNLLTGELEVFEAAVRNTEGQNRILKSEVIRLRQELENMKKGVNLENQTQEMFEIISELEETKQANEKLIYELRVENKKMEIQMRESGMWEVDKVRENFKEKIGAFAKKCELDFGQFSEKIKKIEVRVDKTCKDVSSVQWKVSENVELRNKVQEYQEVIERVSIKETEVKVYREVFYEIVKSLKEFKSFDEPRGGKSEFGVKEIRVYKEYIDELVSELKKSKKVNETLKEQNNELESTQKSQASQLEHNKDLIQKLNKAENDFNELKAENSKIVKEKAENAQSCLSALEKLQNLQEKFLQANERVKILQEEKEQFTALGEGLNKKLWKTEEEVKEKQEEIEDLIKKLREMIELKGKYEDLQKKFLDKEQEVERLQSIVEKYLNDKMNFETCLKVEFEHVGLEEISRLDQEIVHLLEEKSVLLYLDMIQKLLEKLKRLFSSNEELKTQLERQKTEILEKKFKVQDMNQEKALLIQENSALENTLNEKSVLVDKFQQLLDNKNKELGKLQEIMQELIDSSSKSGETLKKIEFPILSEESIPNKYSEIIRDLSENLRKVTEDNEIMKKENKELQMQVTQLVSEISLRENTRNSPSVSSKNLSESYESDKNSVKSNEEHFLSGYEEDKPFENTLPEDQTGEFNKCVSILSPLEPEYKQGENISIVEFPRYPEVVGKVEIKENNEGFEQENMNLQEELRKLKENNEDLTKLKDELQELIGGLIQRFSGLGLGLEEHGKFELSKTGVDEKDLANEVQTIAQKMIEDYEESTKKIKGLSNENQDLLRQLEENEEKFLEFEKKIVEFENLKSLNKLFEKELKGLQSEMLKNESELIESYALQEKLNQLEGFTENLNKEKVDLHTQLEGLINDLESVKKNLKSTSVLNNSLESELNYIKTDREQLKGELNEYKEQLDEYEHVRSELLNENNKLEQRSQILEQENKSLQSSISKIISDLHEQNTIKDELLKVLNENRTLENSEKMLKNQNQNLSTELNASKITALDLQAQINELQEKIKDLLENLKESDKIKEESERVSIENEEIKKENRKLSEDLQELKQNLVSNEEQISSLTGKCEDFDRLQEKNNEMLEKISALGAIEQMLPELEDELKYYKEKLNEVNNEKFIISEQLQNIKEELNDLENESNGQKLEIEKFEKIKAHLEQEQKVQGLSEQSLREKLKKVQFENEGLIKDLEKSTEYKDIIHNLSGIKENLEKENQSLQMKVEEFEKKLNNFEETELNNSRLLEQVEELTETCGKLQSLEKVSRKELEDLSKLYQTLQSEHSVQDLELLKALKENQELMVSLQAAEENIKDLNEALVELKLSNETMIKDLVDKKELESVVPSLVINNQVVERKNKELDNRVKELVNENNELVGKIKEVEDKAEELGNSERDIKNEYSQVLERLRKTDDEFKQIEKALKDKSQENDSISHKLQELVDENSFLKKSLPKLEGDKKDLELSLATSKEDLEKFKEHLKSTKESLSKTQESQRNTEEILKNQEKTLSRIKENLRIKEENLALAEENLKDKEENLIITEESLKNTEENLRNLEEKLRITAEKLKKTEENLNNLLDNFESLAIEKENLLTENDQISDKIIELTSKLETQPDISGIIQSLANANKILDRENKEQALKLNQAEAEISDIKQEFKRLAQAYQTLENENCELKKPLRPSTSLSSRKSAELQKPSLLLLEDPEDLKSALSELLDITETLKKENKELKRRLSNLLEKLKNEAENKEIVPELSEEISAIVKGLQEENSYLKEFIAKRPQEMGVGKKSKKNEKVRSGVKVKDFENESNEDEDCLKNKESSGDEEVLIGGKGKKIEKGGKKVGVRSGKERKRPELYLDEKEMSEGEESNEGNARGYRGKEIKNQRVKEEIISESDSREAGTPEFTSFKEKVKNSPKQVHGSFEHPVDIQARNKDTTKPNMQVKGKGNKPGHFPNSNTKDSRIPIDEYSKGSNPKHPEDQFIYKDQYKRDDFIENEPGTPDEQIFKPSAGKSLERPENRGYKELPASKSVERPESKNNQGRPKHIVSDPSESDYYDYKPQDPYKNSPIQSKEDPRGHYYKGYPKNSGLSEEKSNKYIPREEYYKHQPNEIENFEEMNYRDNPRNLEKPFSQNFREAPKNPESQFYKHPQRYMENPAELYNRPRLPEYEDPEERYYNAQVKHFQKPDDRFYREQPRDTENPGEFYRDYPKNFDDHYYGNRGQIVHRFPDPPFDEEKYRNLPALGMYRGRPMNAGRPEGQYYEGIFKQPENEYFDTQPSAPQDPHYNYPTKSSSLQRPGPRRVNQYYELPEDYYPRGIPKSSSLERPAERYYKAYPGPYASQEDPYFNQELRFKGQENPYFNPQYQFKEDLDARKTAKHPTRSTESHPTVFNPFPEPSPYQVDRPDRKFKQEEPLEYGHAYQQGAQKPMENKLGPKRPDSHKAFTKDPESYEVNQKIPYVEYPPEYFNRPEGHNNENPEENEKFIQCKNPDPSDSNIKNPQITSKPKGFIQDPYYNAKIPQDPIYEATDFPSDMKGRSVSQRPPDSKLGLSDFNERKTPSGIIRDNKEEYFNPPNYKKSESFERPLGYEAPKVRVFGAEPSYQQNEKNPDEDLIPKTSCGQGKLNFSENKEVPREKDSHDQGHKPVFKDEENYGVIPAQNKPKVGETNPEANKERKFTEAKHPDPENLKKPLSREDSWYEVTYKKPEETYKDLPESIEITLDLSNIPGFQESFPQTEDPQKTKNPEDQKSSDKQSPLFDNKDLKQDKYSEMPKVHKDEYEENRPKIYTGKEIKAIQDPGHLDKPNLSLLEDPASYREDPNQYQIKPALAPENKNPLKPLSPKSNKLKDPLDFPHPEPAPSITYQYTTNNTSDSLLLHNTQLTTSLNEAMSRLAHQQKLIEDLLEKLEKSKSPEEKHALSTDIAELLSKIKYQNDLITELENKNSELESRFNRIRNKNNLLEQNTKKYSENVEKVFKDVNKKITVIEKSISNKEERIKAIFNDYSRFKQKYIVGFQEKSKALLDSIFEPKNQGFEDSSACTELDKDDLVKMLRGRIEFLQGKIDALVKSNFVTKEIIENIGDKVHDAIEMIKVD